MFSVHLVINCALLRPQLGADFDTHDVGQFLVVGFSAALFQRLDIQLFISRITTYPVKCTTSVV